MKKNADRFLTAIFCDDIRHEVGNKMSMMGCYQGELHVPSAPTVLPKLCVNAVAVTPIDRPFQSIIFRVVLGDDIELARFEAPLQQRAESEITLDENATKRIGVSAIIAFAPFVIEKPTSLQLFAITEEGEMIGPRLLIKVAAVFEKINSSVTEPKAVISVAKRKTPRKKTALAD